MIGPEYSQLKQEIICGVSENEKHSQLLNTLKDHFKIVINSLRRTEQIISIGQLLKVLEIRDALSEDNIEPLKIIGCKLSNSKELLDRLVKYEMGHVAKGNINYYAIENGPSAKKYMNDTESSVINGNNRYLGLSTNKKKLIDEVIIDELGTKWRLLARNLNIREIVIQEIDKKYDTLADKTKKILEIYEHKVDAQKWFFILTEALEKSKRRDLSRSIQEIMMRSI